MADDPPSRPDLAADEARLAAYASDLADAVDAALPVWVLRCVTDRCAAAGTALTPAIDRSARNAGTACRDDVGPRVRALLRTDPDDQRSTPLALLRQAVRYPTGVLAGAGVPAVRRDDFAVRSFPDDTYDLTPASFRDLDESLHEPGLVWGAAKAHVHLARRRSGDRS
jgi:hypothetical protein